MAFFTGEMAEVTERWSTELSPTVDYRPFAMLTISGVAAFFLNVSSLQVNKLTSPLSLSIAGNAKQVLLIMISTVLFDDHVSPVNGLGIAVTLVGTGVYSYISVMERELTLQDKVDLEYDRLALFEDFDDDMEIENEKEDMTETSSGSDSEADFV
jgi:hypothetical protein